MRTGDAPDTTAQSGRTTILTTTTSTASWQQAEQHSQHYDRGSAFYCGVMTTKELTANFLAESRTNVSSSS